MKNHIPKTDQRKTDRISISKKKAFYEIKTHQLCTLDGGQKGKRKRDVDAFFIQLWQLDKKRAREGVSP